MSLPRSRFLDLDLYDYFYYLTRQIPEGMVSTYGDLADALGDRVAAKSVAEMLSLAQESDNVPHHRMVFSDGTVGHPSHDEERADKIKELRSEGIRIEGNKICDLDKIRFTSFRTDMPLEKIKNEQLYLQRFLEIDGMNSSAKLIGFDVSYSGRNSYSVMVEETGSGYRISTEVGTTKFPYIPSYLAYREFPAIRELYHTCDCVLLFDGNGSLHPRKMGLATFAGIMLHASSIGVAKSQTNFATGREKLSIADSVEGSRISKNIIVSPGNRVSLEKSLEYYRRRFGEKYPEILRIAHNETVKLRKTHLSM